MLTWLVNPLKLRLYPHLELVFCEERSPNKNRQFLCDPCFTGPPLLRGDGSMQTNLGCNAGLSVRFLADGHMNVPPVAQPVDHH